MDVSRPGREASPPASDRDPEAYATHLERNRTVWNRWSDYYGMSESDFEPMRETAMDYLDLDPGDRVLDVGCGPGVNFERLRSDVGPDGEVVAVDYSPEMVGKARERVAEHGWSNVEVREADAASIEFDEPFDAAIASLSMCVMPDAAATARNVDRAVVPGGPIVVFDVRPFQRGLRRVVNPFVRWFLRWYANWNPDDDVEATLSTVFDDAACVESYAGGAAYTVRCTATDRDR